jgi:hypothetical protein
MNTPGQTLPGSRRLASPSLVGRNRPQGDWLEGGFECNGPQTLSNPAEPGDIDQPPEGLTAVQPDLDATGLRGVEHLVRPVTVAQAFQQPLGDVLQ